VKQRDLQLELRGDDTVSYVIDPEFQKANNIELPPKQLDVRYNAELVASAGEILSQEEQERREMEERLNPVAAEDQSARFRGRPGKTVRPGSPIYIQVTDMDRDMTDKPDTVAVASRHLGRRRDELRADGNRPAHRHLQGAGQVRHPLPPGGRLGHGGGQGPQHDDQLQEARPVEQPGRREGPEVAEVDTMSSFDIGGCSIDMPNAAQVRRLTLQGLLDENYEKIGDFPSSTNEVLGGVQVLLARDQAGASIEEIRRFIRIAGDENYRQTKTLFDRKDTSMKGRDGWMSSTSRGLLPAEEHGPGAEIPAGALRERWQHAYLVIDGEPLLGGHLPDKGALSQTRRLR